MPNPVRLLLWVLVLVLPANLFAGERYAFLVAVRQYDKAELTSLRYTEKDITDLAKVLKKSGYPKANVVLMTQTVGAADTRFLPIAKNIRKELDLLVGELRKDDTLLLAFSGHGVQFKNDKAAYFCPADAKLKDKTTLISLGDIYGLLADPKRCKAQTKILLVDACRNDPQTKLNKAVTDVELEAAGKPQDVVPPGGIAAFFSCSAGQQSYEHPDLEHGVFFNFVIEALSGKGDFDNDKEVSLAELEQYAARNVQRYVRVELGRRQTPERKGEARGLVGIARLGNNLIGQKAGETRGDNCLKMTLVWCPPGNFTMGSPKSEKGRSRGSYEDQVQVTLTKGFWLGQTEITQGQWKSVMGSTPWKGERYVKEGSNYAATYVSWEDAIEFCKKLTTQERQAGRLPEGWEYTLPTQAQWEHACRAGTTTAYSFGDDGSKIGEYAWYGGFTRDGNTKDEKYAHIVGTKKPNPWGLSDMHGNVFEWCRDSYADKLPGGRDPEVIVKDSNRMGRNGGWSDYGEDCRSANFVHSAPDYRTYNGGFRVAIVQVR